MNPQEQIQIIEIKIAEIKNTLQTWTEQINNYHSTLDLLIKQLKEVKKSIK